MKKILGVAAAALMLSAGAASAAATKVTISLLGYSCTVSVTKLGDSANGVGKVLLAGNSTACGYVGTGDIGKAKTLGNTATLVGTSSLLGDSYKLLTVFQYPFVSGGNYSAYYTTDGKTLIFLNTGTYTVQ
jgi:hypothetical protein